ncbi:MAG: N-acetylmuramoyl-L-alanine amidase, partial [Pseudomonadota bacterium]
GGETLFLVDQRRHGETWVLLDRFFFNKGTNEKIGAVIFTNESQDTGSKVSMDAVRLGGGLGISNRGGGISNQSRSDECSRYHAQFAGAPSSVYNPSSGTDNVDDVSTRSRFADWVHAPGESAVFISHHSNAYNGNARGTETYVYGTNPPNGSYVPTSETLSLGSDKLAKAIHEEIMSDIRSAYDSSWKDRKVLSAYFGELNPSNQDEMAAALVEIAFHDQTDDVAALKDAEFRRITARAMYKGIVKYFAQKDGTQAHLLPEPPQSVQATNTSFGQITVSWKSPQSGGIFGDPPTSYRVYKSNSGYAFDNGTDTGGKTSLTLKNLQPGNLIYLRVTSTNQGGESLPSPTLAVGVSPVGKATVLLVSAFDRFDSSMNLKISYPKIGNVDRLFIDHINNGTYLVQHGAALDGTKVPFDACIHTAIDDSSVVLTKYEMVIWQGGKGLEGNEALTENSRQVLSSAAASGASLIMSSSVMAELLGKTGSSQQELEFLNDVLHADFVANSDSVIKVTPTSSSTLSGLVSWNLSSWETGPYDVQGPDVLSPIGGTVAAEYENGSGAITQYKDGAQCAVLMGFPLETVIPEKRQAQIMEKLLDYCGIEPPVHPDGGFYPDGGVPNPDSYMYSESGEVGGRGWRTLYGGCSYQESDKPNGVLLGVFGCVLLLGIILMIRFGSEG